ncbi:MAG: DNA polymerase III subunit delta [Phycisphaerales bacterium]|nr:DNA polymerase III subunit delta [Phycisphaerales bacterium]
MGKATAKTQDVAAPVYVLVGEDLILRREKLAKLRADFLGDDQDSIGFVSLGANVAMRDILDECRTIGMFSPRKLVLVDPADALFATRGDESEEHEQDEASGEAGGAGLNRNLLERYLDAPCATALLVLACQTWNKSTRLHKRLAASKCVEFLEGLTPASASAWLVRRAKAEYSKELPLQVANRLIELVGPDRSRLDSELAKLALYCLNEPAISAAAVETLTGFSHEQQIWDMIAALGAGDAKSALQLHEALWQADKKIGFTIVGAVFYWLNQVMRAIELLEKRMSDAEISSELKLWPQQRAANVLQLARRWQFSGARRASQLLLQADLAPKTGLGEMQPCMERFIIQVCAI